MKGKPITLVSLTARQLKLKKGKIAKKKILYIRRTFFANKVLLGFDDDVILHLDTDLLTLKDVFHDTYLRSNIF